MTVEDEVSIVIPKSPKEENDVLVKSSLQIATILVAKMSRYFISKRSK